MSDIQRAAKGMSPLVAWLRLTAGKVIAGLGAKGSGHLQDVDQGLVVLTALLCIHALVPEHRELVHIETPGG